MRAAIVDVGIGNVGSLRSAFERLGIPAALVRGPETVGGEDVVVLPGVGQAAAVMARLAETGWPAWLPAWAARGGPILGICLGLQLLFGPSEEGGEGFRLLPGEVVRLPVALPLPHMGWNRVRSEEGRADDLLRGIPEDAAYFYFAHSYVVRPQTTAPVAATTDYGIPFPSIVRQGGVVGVQFHPEKSGAVGRRFLQNLWEVFAWSASRPSTSSADAWSASTRADSTG